jgi:hypothetical protein
LGFIEYKPYAGIGARDIPHIVYETMENLGFLMAEDDWTLRSGHADGSDIAFERGCDTAGGKKEIYLPKKGFNGSKGAFTPLGPEYYELAGRFYGIDPGQEPFKSASENKAWKSMPSWVTKFHARNTQQIFGKNLDSMVDTVLCYTENARWKGGTAMALRLIEPYRNSGEAMVFNLGDDRYVGMSAQDIFDHVKAREYPDRRQMSLI